MHGGNQSPALFIQHLSRSPVKYLKVRVPGMAVIVSLALWVWVGSGKGLLVVPGDGGAILPPPGPPESCVPERYLGGLDSG